MLATDLIGVEVHAQSAYGSTWYKGTIRAVWTHEKQLLAMIATNENCLQCVSLNLADTIVGRCPPGTCDRAT